MPRKSQSRLPHMTFLCKGAKLNVMPSRMASQMSAGLVAYEITLGKQATRKDIVHIFDYEEENLTNDPKEQIDFFKNGWHHWVPKTMKNSTERDRKTSQSTAPVTSNLARHRPTTQNQIPANAKSIAKYVKIKSAPARLIDPNVSRTTRASSIAPAWAPNLIIAYSPLT